MNFEKVFKTLVDETKDYVLRNGLKSMVLGISGGIDSTIVAAICSEISKDTGIPFIGRSLPNRTNKQEEKTTAGMVGIAFCDDFNTISIEEWYTKLSDDFYSVEGKQSKIAEGNIQARLRMIYLYNLASLRGGLVLSTDNATEWNLGFWTLHGDVGDFNPLFGLWKTEVYGLAKWLVERYRAIGDSAKAIAISTSARLVPTDGLGISSSDLEQIGASSYEEVDTILQSFILWRKIISDPTLGDPGLIKYKTWSEIIDTYTKLPGHITNETEKKILERHLKSEFKRKNLPVVIERKRDWN